MNGHTNAQWPRRSCLSPDTCTLIGSLFLFIRRSIISLASESDSALPPARVDDRRPLPASKRRVVLPRSNAVIWQLHNVLCASGGSEMSSRGLGDISKRLRSDITALRILDGGLWNVSTWFPNCNNSIQYIYFSQNPHQLSKTNTLTNRPIGHGELSRDSFSGVSHSRSTRGHKHATLWFPWKQTLAVRCERKRHHP